MNNKLKAHIDFFIENKNNMSGSEREEYLDLILDTCDIPYSKYDLPKDILVNLINKRIRKNKNG